MEMIIDLELSLKHITLKIFSIPEEMSGYRQNDTLDDDLLLLLSLSS
jgi:hypothetical protein